MIRTYRPEDLDRVIESHAKLYREEYGYDDSFARFVEKGVRDFGKRMPGEREQLRIVETENGHAGSLGLTEADAETARPSKGMKTLSSRERRGS
ncbi:hypothetical protein QWJ34_07220 [Saccharibacillus sp. CPCC 101409]|uniref:hypothetical protein n=1 Tax=Saccharibacillus sp. CPCC 101409 TaxID=3058041 RepID=UPI00267335D6|nr:hypothetical protein [Saccharibacillus sp. CPCC 101409]MDO3409550.1 hypothetical protein [Saccharibacillus sp. CPCC 101409]